MAKRASKKDKATTAEPKEEQKKPAPQPSLQLISASALKALLRSDDRHKENIDAIIGQLREEIGDAVERKKLDKQAYALLKRFHRIKSNEKLATLWDTLCAYMDMSGITARIESVAELPLSEETGEEETGEAERAGATITPFPNAAA